MRIQKIKESFATTDGHNTALEDADGKCACSVNGIFRMRLHYQHTCLSLINDLEKMPNGKKWIDLCEHSIVIMPSLGCNFITRSRASSSKHLSCRRNNDSFPNPSFPRSIMKKSDLITFCENPTMKKIWFNCVK